MSAQRQGELLALTVRLWELAAHAERYSARWYRIDIVAGHVLSRCTSEAQIALLGACAL